MRLLLLSLPFIIYLVRPVLGYFNNFDLPNGISNIGEGGFMNNGYFLMFLFSSLFGNVFKYITSFLQFIGSSTFVTWMEIPNNPDIKDWMNYYLNKKFTEGKVYTLSIDTETATSTNQTWYDKDKFDGYPQTRHIPGSSLSLFMFKRYPILINKSGSIGQTMMSGQMGMGSYGGGSLSLKTICWPWNRNKIWKELIKEVRGSFIDSLKSKQQIYKIKKNGDGQSFGATPMIVDNQGFSDGSYVLTPQMSQIANGVKHFLSEETRKHYLEHNLSYCHRIYVHGPPGTGKSQLAYRIAGEYNLPIYHLNCEYLSNGDIELVFDTVQRGIIIVEEIDTCIDELKKENINSDRKVPTLSGWHKVLDTIAGNQVIVYMTTNNHHLISSLNHGSLIRKERVDQVAYIGNINIKAINDIINKHYGVKDETKHVDGIYTNENNITLLTPAEIINIIKMTKGNMQATVKGIKNLSEDKSRHIKMMQDGIKNKYIKKL